jgi:hypothetical protein
MPLLNYLGNGSMPAGVPGAAAPLAPRVGSLPPVLSSPSGPGAGVPPAPPAALAALQGMHDPMRGGSIPPSAIHSRIPMGGNPPPPSEPHPSEHRYEAVTQQDGSILLHLKMSDGKLGPVVKIVPAPNVPGAKGASK